MRFEFIPLSDLLPHERTDPKRKKEVMRLLVTDGIIRKPILVDGNTLVVLDGHHRVACLKELRCRLVPALLVDYADEGVALRSRRRHLQLEKCDIINSALLNLPFPPKTSRHIYDDSFSVNASLELLK